MSPRPWRFFTLCALAAAWALPARASGGVKKVPEGAAKPPVTGGVSSQQSKPLGTGLGNLQNPGLDLPALPAPVEGLANLPAQPPGLAPTEFQVQGLAAPKMAAPQPVLQGPGQGLETLESASPGARVQGSGGDKGTAVLETLETLETLDKSVGRSLQGTGSGLSGKQLSDEAYDVGGPKAVAVDEGALAPAASQDEEAAKAAAAQRLSRYQAKAQAEEKLVKALLEEARNLELKAEELEAAGHRSKAAKKRRQAARALHAAEEVKEFLRTDPKTGVLNRYGMWLLAGKFLMGLKNPAVAFLDMNNLGAINRGLINFLESVFEGRLKGDEALRRAGQRLKEIARENGVLVGRFGGEEFAVAGELENVLAFIRQVQLEFKGDTVKLDGGAVELKRGQILKDAGLGDRELSFVARALSQRGREGQEAGNFTFGVALADPALLQRARLGEVEPDAVFEEERVRADQRLTQAKESGLRGLAVLEDGAGDAKVLEAPRTPSGYHPPERAPPVQGRLSDRMGRMGEFLSQKERGLLEKEGFTDELTGARTAAWVDAKRGAWGQRHRASRAVLVMIRGLKLINDYLTHVQGDRILRRLVAIMKEEIAREPGKVLLEESLRWGQNEFGLLGSPEEVQRVLGRVRDRYSELLQRGGLLAPEELRRIQRKLQKGQDGESQRLRAEFERIGELYQAGAKVVLDAKGMANVHETFRDASLSLYEAEESGESYGWGRSSPAGLTLSAPK